MFDDADAHFLEPEEETEEAYKTALQLKLQEVVHNCLWGEGEHKALVIYVNGSTAETYSLNADVQEVKAIIKYISRSFMEAINKRPEEFN